ncbi:MAG TPA: hypothetical protein V6D50_18460 [Chroococcales cyanobacterium]|jgi:hypothetical protein
MGLTNRSRLTCVKSKQKRLQREIEKQNPQSPSISKPAPQPVIDTSARDKAWQKYLQAKAIYEQTGDIAHWQYLQKCISDYDKTITPSLSGKAS